MKPGAERTGDANGLEERDAGLNAAMRELLDHLARELAEEYVRLMKQALKEEEE